MSIADPRCGASAAAGRRGYTVIEAVIVTVLVSLMSLVIERTVTGINQAEQTLRAVRNTTERGQKAAWDLRDLVTSSRKLFGNDVVGNAYVAKLDRTKYPVLAGSRLPIFDEVNPLGPDVAGTPQTGNQLLFVRESDALPCVAVAATKKMRIVDAYRLVSIYLTVSNRKLVNFQPNALDLVEWRSKQFPSYGQVLAITPAAERTSVVRDLYNRWGIDYLWDPAAPVASAFYGIDGVGNISATPSVVASIAEDMNVSKGTRFVMRNIGVTRTDVNSYPRNPMFSIEPVATWTPNGFECKVAGASGSRKVWMRLSVEQQAAAGRIPCLQTTVVANTRDL
jgi:hypothetical protein